MKLVVIEADHSIPFAQLLGESPEEWKALEAAAAEGDFSCGLGVPAGARLRALARRLGRPVGRSKTLTSYVPRGNNDR